MAELIPFFRRDLLGPWDEGEVSVTAGFRGRVAPDKASRNTAIEARVDALENHQGTVEVFGDAQLIELVHGGVGRVEIDLVFVAFGLLALMGLVVALLPLSSAIAVVVAAKTSLHQVKTMKQYLV